MASHKTKAKQKNLKLRYPHMLPYCLFMSMSIFCFRYSRSPSARLFHAQHTYTCIATIHFCRAIDIHDLFQTKYAYGGDSKLFQSTWMIDMDSFDVVTMTGTYLGRFRAFKQANAIVGVEVAALTRGNTRQGANDGSTLSTQRNRLHLL